MTLFIYVVLVLIVHEILFLIIDVGSVICASETCLVVGKLIILLLASLFLIILLVCC